MAFLKNPTGFWDLASAAQTHARATFEPSVVARQTAELYAEIARARR